jgi:hypothetical protein
MEGRIKVKISKKGEVKISVEGVEGSSCTDLTEALEKKLGVVEEDVLTDEYYLEQDEEREPAFMNGDQ